VTEQVYHKELGTKIPSEKVLTSFLEEFCEAEIIELVESYPDVGKHCPGNMEDCPDYVKPRLGSDTKCCPDIGTDCPNYEESYPGKSTIHVKFTDISKFSKGLEKAIINHFFLTQDILQNALANVKFFKGSNKIIDEKLIKFRITDIPVHLRKSIRGLSSWDIGTLVCVDGFAKSASDIQMRATKTAFQCLRCGHITIVEQNSLKLQEPFSGCENDTCEKKGPFKLMIEDSTYREFQRLTLQESPDSARGTKIRDISVDCYDDLTNQAEPGERITVTGVLRTIQITDREGKTTLYEMFIDAVSIQKQEIDFSDYNLSEEDEEAIL
jgi:replicative DNA helicase Mcm